MWPALLAMYGAHKSFWNLVFNPVVTYVVKRLEPAMAFKLECIVCSHNACTTNWCYISARQASPETIQYKKCHALATMCVYVQFQKGNNLIINSYCPFWAQYQEISRVHCWYCLRVCSTSKQCRRQWMSDVSIVLRSKRIIRNLSYRLI